MPSLFESLQRRVPKKSSESNFEPIITKGIVDAVGLLQASQLLPEQVFPFYQSFNPKEGEEPYLLTIQGLGYINLDLRHYPHRLNTNECQIILTLRSASEKSRYQKILFDQNVFPKDLSQLELSKKILHHLSRGLLLQPEEAAEIYKNLNTWVNPQRVSPRPPQSPTHKATPAPPNLNQEQSTSKPLDFESVFHYPKPENFNRIKLKQGGNFYREDFPNVDASCFIFHVIDDDVNGTIVLAPLHFSQFRMPKELRTLVETSRLTIKDLNHELDEKLLAVMIPQLFVDHHQPGIGVVYDASTRKYVQTYLNKYYPKITHPDLQKNLFLQLLNEIYDQVAANQKV